jgi:predicted phosphodiesterase
MIPNSLGPKIAVTTGAITVVNYTDSKIGKQGEFNHILGFIYLDVKNRIIRAISAEKNGNFQDINVYLDDGEIKYKKIITIVFGDIHYGKENKSVYYNSIEFANKYKIQNIVLHDIFDGESISHHHDNLLLKKYFKLKDNFTVKDELDMVVKKLIELHDMLKYDKKIYIVRSNHDEHLDKWINKGFASVDLNNLEHFADIIAQMIKNKKIDGALELYIKNELVKLKRKDVLKDLVFIDRRQPVKIKGWLISEHGDQGINGVRGSVAQYKKLSDKIIVGHTHVPMRYNNVVYVGCICDKNADYLKGISTWEYANAIILENGKVQHIFNN